MDNNNLTKITLLMHMKSISEKMMNRKSYLMMPLRKMSEEELGDIHPYLEHSFPSPIINSGIMNVHHNYPNNFID